MHPSRIPRHNAKGGRVTSPQQSPRLSQSLPFTSPEKSSKNRLSFSSSPRDFNKIRRRSRSMEHLLDEEMSVLYSPDSAALKLKNLLTKHERKRSDPLPLSEPSELRSKVSHIPKSVGISDSYFTGEPPDNLPRSEDLIPFLNSQGAYIQQLEGENNFYKEELLSLRSKTDGVVRENERLQEELKTVIIGGLLKEEKSYEHAMPQKDKKTQNNTENSQQDVEETDGGKTFFIAWSKEHEKLKSLYESRVSLLESQITYTRSELIKYEKICEELKQKLRMQASSNLMNRLDGEIEQGLCAQCAKERAIVVPDSDTQKTAAELAKVIRERDELVESLTGVRTRVLEMQEREGDAYHQVQQGILLVEQAQLDRTEALIEKEQLKEDLARMERRLNQQIVDNQMKLQRERDVTRQECQQEIITLNEKTLQLQNEMAATQVQLEREIREKNNFKSELEETKSLLKEQEDEMDKFSDGAQYTAATAKVQRDTAYRQMERVRNSLEMELQAKEQERMRLFTELQDVRRRMDTAEKSLTLSKEEIVSLTDQINSIDRELSMVRVSKETLERTRTEEVKLVSRRAEQREQELKQVIHEMEAQHSLTSTGLEAMISDQNSLIGKLRDQARFLTAKLEKMTEDYSQDKHHLRYTNKELLVRADRLSQQHSEMEEQCVQHGKLHQRMKTKLKQMEEHARRTAKQTCSLLQTQRNLLEERKALSKEVDFLQSQLKDKQDEPQFREQIQNLNSLEGHGVFHLENIPTRDTPADTDYDER